MCGGTMNERINVRFSGTSFSPEACRARMCGPKGKPTQDTLRMISPYWASSPTAFPFIASVQTIDGLRQFPADLVLRPMKMEMHFLLTFGAIAKGQFG